MVRPDPQLKNSNCNESASPFSTLVPMRSLACIMKLETTRPSYGCIPGPYVLKMRATRISTPEQGRENGTDDLERNRRELEKCAAVQHSIEKIGGSRIDVAAGGDQMALHGRKAQAPMKRPFRIKAGIKRATMCCFQAWGRGERGGVGPFWR